MTEERVVDPDTGGAKGRKDIEFGFLDPIALEELGRVASMGSKKYEPFNYLKGFSWMLSVNAMFRHTFAFLRGEDRDPESGCHHMAHTAWHALSLVSFTLRKLGKDDRAPRQADTRPDSMKQDTKFDYSDATDLCANGDHYFMDAYGDENKYLYSYCTACGVREQ